MTLVDEQPPNFDQLVGGLSAATFALDSAIKKCYTWGPWGFVVSDGASRVSGRLGLDFLPEADARNLLAEFTDPPAGRFSSKSIKLATRIRGMSDFLAFAARVGDCTIVFFCYQEGTNMSDVGLRTVFWHVLTVARIAGRRAPLAANSLSYEIPIEFVLASAVVVAFCKEYGGDTYAALGETLPDEDMRCVNVTQQFVQGVRKLLTVREESRGPEGFIAYQPESRGRGGRFDGNDYASWLFDFGVGPQRMSVNTWRPKHMNKLLLASTSQCMLLCEDMNVVGFAGVPHDFPCVRFRFERGRVEVSVGTNSVAFITATEITFRDTSAPPDARVLQELFPGRIQDVELLAEKMRDVASEGHGATIVLEDIVDGHTDEGAHNLRRRLDAGDIPARFLGRLGAIDGAVTFNSALQLCNFGRILRSGESGTTNLERGARFNSALHYSAARLEAILFIVSADGGTSIIQEGKELWSSRLGFHTRG